MTATSVIDDRQRKEELGQFFTAPHVARLMVSMLGPLPERVRLLDAGAGAGALTRALVERCCEQRDKVRFIEATAYEVDIGVLGALTASMLECEKQCDEVGIRFRFTIRSVDFIQEIASCLAGDLFGAAPPDFDVAITNPPYRKIGADSRERAALRWVGIETSNLYTGFVALILRLLKPGGQIVAITPRSFCNGPYFRPFREDLLARLDLRRLHVFESRQAAFRGDSVLQENIVFFGVQGRQQSSEVIVSSSRGDPGGELRGAGFPFSEIIRREDPQKFIHIPSSSDHAVAKTALGSLGASLASLGIRVSTGRVVDFRLKDALRKQPEPGAVPLLYPCHFEGGSVVWPKLDARKPNAIVDNPRTRPWLVPSGVYLLTKRFTSKEERRRLVACVFDPELIRTEWIRPGKHSNARLLANVCSPGSP